MTRLQDWMQNISSNGSKSSDFYAEFDATLHLFHVVVPSLTLKCFTNPITIHYNLKAKTRRLYCMLSLDLNSLTNSQRLIHKHLTSASINSIQKGSTTWPNGYALLIGC